MRSHGFMGASAALRTPRFFLVLLFSACGLLLLLNLSSLSDGANKIAPLVGLENPDFYNWKTKPFIRHDSFTAKSKDDKLPTCAGFPADQLRDIQVVLKIGASEDKQKIQASLDTVNSCFQDLLIFSDMTDTIGSHDVIDILADLPDSYAEDNPDFRVYEAQREAKAKNESAGPGREGWRLDRFKFLPMVEKAYTMRPEKSWYVFIEVDTYLSWDNLYRFLDHFNPMRPLYLGSPVPGSYGRWFAHGGSGFVLSTGAIQKFLARPEDDDEAEEGSEAPSVHAHFEKMVKDDCCGDAVLGYALAEKDIRLDGYFPLFNGDNSEGMRLSMDKWCQPIITMHHIGPDEMHALWDWETNRRTVEKPLLHSDLFHFIHPTFSITRTNWDNFSGGTPHDGANITSFRDCGKACQADPDCFQYSFQHEACRFETSLRLGAPRNLENGEQVMSGWNMQKVGELKANDCKSVQWPKASYGRRG